MSLFFAIYLQHFCILRATLHQASCNLTECLREKENLNDEELEEAGKLLQIVKDNYQKIIELIVQL